MTEDVLEQVVDDWLRRRGYFTRTNVRFGPGKTDVGYTSRDHNQTSDLDVLAVTPTLARNNPAAVYAVSCKAMQNGFSPNGWLAAVDKGLGYKGRKKGEAWKHLRELWDPVWARSLRTVVHDLTGAKRFTYVLAVTRLGRGGSDDLSVWTRHDRVSANLAGNPCQLWTFAGMWADLSINVTEQIEPSHIGRLAQLLKAVQADGQPVVGSRIRVKVNTLGRD